ncbi:methionine ABC transporter ATP-binding protein [Clostridium tagluense]|uniref:methionine ABC transporter ATP-binding protein n=1 Tax=Clostridium tagluense TaxID=360422 RepID=UPI001CF5F1FF|nr:methionine ABC transporter ATP-binding protein [Clostridium tagluense]MCB2310296.1 methionine ABC transporter ATP-binding protein [Clostridium tagluense]MCB2315062.1 methionine ABC transporter ATP-binding protein [Clostridium tagluense]MCB2319996.1 methionine ABC transporter ATP-binding protein [Clostridium tagluense]MCB2324805.1 methionine ABC transporter ATP-binding protein [Clostridium tagluense]MCB2329741.1 methionine ABC transporter ATP-binding protein [Clostridium tagluense]
MIWIKGVRKVYVNKQGIVEALKEINLHVEKGKIFGIIGYSGAGKSTLVRCINLLEKPTSGQVIVNNKELTKLPEKELRKSRKKIGMIFQHFNLMSSRNVFQNVAYPLKGNIYTKEEKKQKVLSLLELVGLSDKVLSYPSQLSGGQKQRVAIARALANDPQVLLCDEATSAIDPQTTASILKLLKEINEKLGLTIVIITHQMEVVKEICHEVAVMEAGQIVESGGVIDIFTNPKAEITKEFISTVFNYDKIYDFLCHEEFEEGESVAKISFVGQKTGQAFISKLSRKFKIDASILFGNIEIIQHIPIGNLIVKFSGTKEGIVESIKYLEENNINVEVIKHAAVFSKLPAKRSGIIS